MRQFRRLRLPAAALALAAALLGGDTKNWNQSEYSDFEKGSLKGLSLRSDGGLTLAPQFREVFDSSAAYLWALARDSAGNLYTGGGPGAKLFRISASGEKKTIAEFDALDVHAIAIDRRDQVFVGTSPDGKVYKISAAGKPEIYYDPKTKYIWALAFNSKGDLFVATGDGGEIHRVTPDGKGSVFFRSEETHVRSLAIDAKDNIVAGTDPGGLIIRVSPAGDGFVLYQMPKKEVTAVSIGKDGSIYAAGVGTKQAGTPTSSSLPAPVPAPPPVSPTAAGSIVVRVATPSTPSLSATSSGVAGGSEIYRIYSDGHPQRIWSNAQDIVYTLGFDPQGRTLAGTGNKGHIYRLDTDNLYTVLLSASSTQITAFCPGKDGKIYAATGNAGQIYEIGPGLDQEGSIESDVFDAGLFSNWGRLIFAAQANGGRIAIVTRSGNLDRPARNWSAWSNAITTPEGARIASPAARFLQWKATLYGNGSASPAFESVDVAYLSANVAPKIDIVEITPQNYRFPAPTAVSALSPPSLNLPALGRGGRGASASLDSSSTPAMPYAKGHIGARWNASDENSDTLTYTVEIRGVKETTWKLLKDKVREKYLSWDSTAFPDGEYRVRVTASDLPSNPPEQALSGQLESSNFLIDNTAPRISGLTASRNGSNLNVRWKATDALSFVAKAEYSIDGGEWLVTLPTTKLSDSRELDYDLTLTNIPPGEHTIAVRVQDEYENQSADKAVMR